MLRSCLLRYWITARSHLRLINFLIFLQYTAKKSHSVLVLGQTWRSLQLADRQQPVLQRFVRPQLGCPAAEHDASAFKHESLLGKTQGEVDPLLGEEHRNPGVVA